jgi:hypothetical protein
VECFVGNERLAPLSRVPETGTKLADESGTAAMKSDRQSGSRLARVRIPLKNSRSRVREMYATRRTFETWRLPHDCRSAAFGVATKINIRRGVVVS